MAKVLEFDGVDVDRSGKSILRGVSLSVDESERWVILGPNGAGKSTLLNLAGAAAHPTRGAVTILGERLGTTDIFELRPRIGVASTALGRRIPSNETVRNVILTAAYAVTGRWRERYDNIDELRADSVIEQWNLQTLADRTFGTLSDGEQKRVQIARAVMTDPELLLFDEPAGSLDLGAREALLESLSALAADPDAPSIVMVTHHVEEIPPGFTHVLLLSDGGISAAGPLHATLTSENLSAAFGRPLAIEERDGRFSARGVSAP
ncbi:ABC transporter ATP-binding protein [Humidisolicoccus flavus]|uniref:ABC transporter ATP-binding protein n=1 Tax=Humidisolicoccus flavus TaxID=3111414 RepID=UPI003252A573